MEATPLQKDLIKDPITGKPRPKLRRVPVWIVTIKMPRRLIDGESIGDRMASDDEIDQDALNQAYDQDLDNSVETGAEENEPQA
jgi:hypothetical protein